jgi:hypothetical protein
VTITILGGYSGYQGSTRNGIVTNNYGQWQGSFQFASAQTVHPGAVPAPANMTEYRGNNGTLYTFTVIGTNNGSVWGGNTGVYTDDSKISTAAVHAGLVGLGQQATIKVRVLQGQSSYQGSTRNGITTKDYGAWQGSYRFE